jgi:hypothetical protein
MDGYAAAFVAIGYTFSTQMMRALFIFPFSMIAMTVPMAVYLALEAALYPGIRRYVIASLPVVAMLLGGYVPIALTAVVLTAAGVAFWFLVLHDDARALREKIVLIARGWVPLVLGWVVPLPYYIAVFLNLRGVQNPANVGSLAFSAHDMAEPTHALLRGISDYLTYPGPLFEFTLHWGVIGIAIVLLYVLGFDRRTPGQVLTNRLFLACFVAYVFFMLIIFGDTSVFSDLVFYFVPVIGYMHIYQRHLIFAQFFLAILFLLMLESAIARPARTAAKALFLASGFVLLAAAHLAFFGNQPWKEPYINEHFVFECLLTTIFLFTAVVFDRRVVLLTATIFMAALAMNRFYDLSKPENSYAVKSQTQVGLQPALLSSMADFMVRNSGKELTKYHNMTPGIVGYVPQNIPWLLGREVKLSNYQSYDLHVSTPLAYQLRMHAVPLPGSGIWNSRPDWEWMRQTGADFIIFNPANPGNDPRIREFVDMADPEQVFTLPDQSVIARLKFPPLAGPRVASDNGYVRLRSDAPGAGIRSFATDDGTYLRATVESGSPSLLEYEFWPHRDIHVEINGKPAAFKLNSAGLPYVELPGGRSEVAILYRNRWVTAFGAMYLLYALLVAGVAAPPVYRALRGARLTA